MTSTVAEAADALAAAQREAAPRGLLTAGWPDLDQAVAYEIQDELLSLRRDRGETVTGIKVGLTSAANRAALGADRQALGWLTDAMRLPAGSPAAAYGLVAPRAEPEIAFTLRSRLTGPGVTPAAALAAVESVHAAIEIVDSRYADPFGSGITPADLIADNCMAARYLTGPVAVSPKGLDLALEGCLLEVDGQIVDSATGAACDGNPAESLAAAANLLGERGLTLESGWTVLTGTLTQPVDLVAGSHVAVHFSHLGSITVSGG